MADADTSFEAFREIVFDDFALQLLLRQVTERAAFFAQVVALGSQRGFDVSTDHVVAAVQAGERNWLRMGALSDETMV